MSSQPASNRHPDQEQTSFRWVSNPDLLLWCTLSKHILIRMSTPWSTKAGDSTFHTRVTHCNIDFINVEAEIQAHRLELHAVWFRQARGVLPKETRQRHGGAEDLFKVRGSGQGRSGIEAFHTRVLKLRPQAS